jgi:hypothetical protein
MTRAPAAAEKNTRIVTEKYKIISITELFTIFAPQKFKFNYSKSWISLILNI